jgi:hypothetical protein
MRVHYVWYWLRLCDSVLCGAVWCFERDVHPMTPAFLCASAPPFSLLRCKPARVVLRETDGDACKVESKRSARVGVMMREADRHTEGETVGDPSKVEGTQLGPIKAKGDT